MNKFFMQHKLIISFILLYFIIGLYSIKANADELPNWEQWDDSVIRLLVIGQNSIESGTAFAINDNGDYVTNHHVIETALKGGNIEAVESLKPKKTHEVKIIWESEEFDLAVVHVETWKNNALILGQGEMLKKGQDVFTIGFPGAADRNAAEFNVATLKKGVFSAFKHFSLKEGGRKISMIEHDASVNSGNSGGPLADACGRVVGINEQKSLGSLIRQGNTVAVNSSEGILFSINSKELITLLKQHNTKYTFDDSKCSLTTGNGSLSNTILILIVSLGFLVTIAFIYLYRRTQQVSPDGRFNTRVLSRMIRDRITPNIHNTSHHRQDTEQPRTYFSQNRGRIIHRNEQDNEAKDNSSEPAGTTIQELYRLVPQRNDIGLPILYLRTHGNYRLGRNPADNIQLVVTNQYVSSEHILITVNPDESVVVEALETTNKTKIDGQTMEVGEFRNLSIGQTISLGHDEVNYVLQRG